MVRNSVNKNTDPTLVEGLTSINPLFGDHVLIMFDIRSRAVVEETRMRRDWRHYNRDALKSHLELVNWSMDYDFVQSNWNALKCA